jgi:hypothetical protein
VDTTWTLPLIKRERDERSGQIINREARLMRSFAGDRAAFEERLSFLEEQNRRLKWGGIAVLIAFSAVLLMGQAKPTPRSVEAEKFVLKDANGNVRGWMGVIGEGSEIVLGNSNRQPMLTLEVSTDSDDLHFYGSRNSGMNLGLNSGDPSISLMGAEKSGAAGIIFRKNGPSLKLEDAKGYTALIGATESENAVNGQTKFTSAASVVLLDNHKKIIWKAP